jgi:hypothetical protein
MFIWLFVFERDSRELDDVRGSGTVQLNAHIAAVAAA